MKEENLKDKMVSIKQLQKSIAIEKEKVKKAQEKRNLRIQESRLKQELFQLRNPKASPGKAERILRRGGRGFKEFLKKATPIVRKQFKLIREQQLRDDAIARRTKESKLKPKAIERITPIKRKGKRRKIKKIKVLKRRPKQISQPSNEQQGIFGNLDF